MVRASLPDAERANLTVRYVPGRGYLRTCSDSSVKSMVRVFAFSMRVLHRDLNGWFVELDQDMLATNSKRQKWKSAAIRAECRHSYK
jgi:hypothetical protein